MELMVKLQVYVISISLLMIIYTKIKEEEQVYCAQDSLFKYLTLSTICLLVLEAISWCVNGCPGRLSYLINISSNLLILMTNLTPLVIWTLYIMNSFNNSKRYLIKGFIPMGILMFVNMLLALTALINKRYFYIDENNLYHRGELAVVGIAMYGSLIIYSIYIILHNWGKINQRNRIPMLLFPLLPITGFILQMLFYGTSWLWPAASISILMAYMQVQSQFIKIDYLTGLYNRRELDFYLDRKLKYLPKNKKLAGIMIDLDDFKLVNDQHGHMVGDRAIKKATSIIKKHFHKNEFIARYGGDEFIILFEIKDEIELKKHVTDLRSKFHLFNQKKEDVFDLRMSVGYKVYTVEDKGSSMFLERLDFLMYEDKKIRKSKRV